MKKAFTLIELLVVVLIIGILAAVALPQYQKAVLKSRMVQGLVGLSAFETAQKEYRLANGSYTSDLSTLAVTKTCFNFCGTVGTAEPLVYCDCSIKSGVLNIEWQGTNSGKTLWICYAKIGNKGANSVCSSYQKEWGGTSIADNNGYTYYYGTLK